MNIKWFAKYEIWLDAPGGYDYMGDVIIFRPFAIALYKKYNWNSRTEDDRWKKSSGMMLFMHRDIYRKKVKMTKKDLVLSIYL